jgi:hypothetical protein
MHQPPARLAKINENLCIAVKALINDHGERNMLGEATISKESGYRCLMWRIICLKRESSAEELQSLLQ